MYPHTVEAPRNTIEYNARATLRARGDVFMDFCRNVHYVEIEIMYEITVRSADAENTVPSVAGTVCN